MEIITTNEKPPAPRTGPKGRWADLKLDELEVGMSRIVKRGEKQARRVVNAIRCHASRVSDRTGFKFSIYLVSEGIQIHRWK